jgi:thiamine biosynthesis lipoprotein
MRWFLVLAPVLLVAGCGRAAVPERFHGPTMGTTYSIEVARRPAAVGREQLQATIDEVLAETGRHLSTYDAASEISRFNAAATTEAVEVSEPLGSVVAIANEVSVASGGAFDITVGPLVRAWGFAEAGAGVVTAPDAQQLARLRAEVGYDKLQLQKDRRALRKAVAGLQLDVNGIAPGYAVDRIAERFEALGVNNYLIELGGEVRAHGRSPAGRPWRVAIEAPLAGERKPYAVVELDGLGASTSGDYRDFRMVGGRRVSHTIDPRTGAPVTHGLASVCVVDKSTARADAFSTALMVLGPQEGMQLATRLGLAALFIVRSADGAGFTSQATPEFQHLRRPLD